MQVLAIIHEEQYAGASVPRGKEAMLKLGKVIMGWIIHIDN